MTNRPNLEAERSGNVLAIYIAIDPVSDWLSSSPLNSVLGFVKITDLLSLLFLLSFAFLLRERLGWWRRLDGYSLSIVAITVYRLLVDSFQDDVHIAEDVPRMLLNFVLYVAASGAIVVRSRMLIACFCALFVYYLGCALQVVEGGIGQRFSSVFLIPNFLAFNALNMFVLVRALQVGGWASALLSLSFVGLIALSKTRTVLMTLVFFYRAIKSVGARFLVVCAVLVFSMLGGGESVRIAGEVDDFWNFDGRVPIWIAIVDRFEEFNLIFGSGSDALRRYEVFVMYDDRGDEMGYLKAQNHYLQTLVELGAVGFIIWVLGIVAYLRRIYLSRRWNSNSLLGGGFVAALLVIQIFENDIFINPTVSVVMGLLISRSFVLFRR